MLRVHDVNQDVHQDNFLKAGQVFRMSIQISVKGDAIMQKLNDKLDQIDKHISSVDQLDPALKQEYNELNDNIRKMMVVKNENAASNLAALDSDARSIAARFEVKHPHAGGLIRQLADILQSMGV